jgi:hypothetical protein
MKVAQHSVASGTQRIRRGFALVCLLLFLLLEIFARSSALHHALHTDAHSPHHTCVITLLAQGQVNIPIVAGIWIAFVAAFVFLLPSLRTVACFLSDLRLSPDRAPPVF